RSFRIVGQLCNGHALRIQPPDAGSQTGNEPTAAAKADASDFLLQQEMLQVSGRRIEPVDRGAPDIDKIQDLFRNAPDRAFAKLGATVCDKAKDAFLQILAFHLP